MRQTHREESLTIYNIYRHSEVRVPEEIAREGDERAAIHHTTKSVYGL